MTKKMTSDDETQMQFYLASITSMLFNVPEDKIKKCREIVDSILHTLNKNDKISVRRTNNILIKDYLKIQKLIEE